MGGGGDFGSGSGSKFNCAARVGSGQTISGTGRVRASVLSPCRPLPQGRNSGQKKRIDLTLRKTLTPRSSESGFHRNVKFATFEQAGRLCKTIPQNGVKVVPLGGRSVPKLPH